MANTDMYAGIYDNISGYLENAPGVDKEDFDLGTAGTDEDTDYDTFFNILGSAAMNEAATKEQAPKQKPIYDVQAPSMPKEELLIKPLATKMAVSRAGETSKAPASTDLATFRAAWARRMQRFREMGAV